MKRYIILYYTYKTTLRAIRRIGGVEEGGGARGPTSKECVTWSHLISLGLTWPWSHLGGV